MNTRLAPLALLALALVVQFRDSKAVCCSPYFVPMAAGLCEDGDLGTPCCGVGRCNIFCCNCDDGCRKSRYRAPGENDASVEEEDTFENNDKDGDGKISQDEARNWVKGGNCGNPADLETDFGVLDQNGDGFLDRDEIGAN